MQQHMSEHICNAETCPDDSFYFVSAIDGHRTYYIAGPYRTHKEALADVDKAREIVTEKDSSGRAHFMAWGTLRLRDMNPGTRGSLNKMGLI